MKQKKLLLLIPLFLIISISAYYILTLRENLFVKVGASIADLELEDVDGNCEPINNFLPKKNVIFYLSSGCSPCIDQLPSIQLLCGFLKNSECPSIIVWRKSIPQKLTNNEKYNYRLKNGEFSNYTPYFYYIENDHIIFETQNLEKIIKKMILSSNSNELQKDFLRYYINKNKIHNEYIYFSFLSDDSDEQVSLIPDNADIVKISNNNIINTLYDPYFAISNLFGITKYPSCIKCNTKTFDYEILE